MGDSGDDSRAFLGIALMFSPVVGRLLGTGLAAFAAARLAGTLAERGTLRTGDGERLMAPGAWGFWVAVACSVILPAVTFLVLALLM